MRPFIALVQQPCLKSFIVAQRRSVLQPMVFSFQLFSATTAHKMAGPDHIKLD
jgi:hypothetical protein